MELEAAQPTTSNPRASMESAAPNLLTQVAQAQLKIQQTMMQVMEAHAGMQKSLTDM